jgi:hypothetical protein
VGGGRKWCSKDISVTQGEARNWLLKMPCFSSSRLLHTTSSRLSPHKCKAIWGRRIRQLNVFRDTQSLSLESKFLIFEKRKPERQVKFYRKASKFNLTKSGKSSFRMA